MNSFFELEDDLITSPNSLSNSGIIALSIICDPVARKRDNVRAISDAILGIGDLLEDSKAESKDCRYRSSKRKPVKARAGLSFFTGRKRIDKASTAAEQRGEK